jgi:integrase
MKTVFNNLESHFGATKLEEIDHIAMQGYVSARLNDGVKTATVNRELTVLSKTLKWATDIGYLPVTPRVPWQSVTKSVPRSFTSKEMDSIIQTLQSFGYDEAADFVRVLRGTGARPGEILALTPEQCDFERKTILVRATKTNSERLLPMTPDVYEVLSARQKPRMFTLEYPVFQDQWRRMRKALGHEGDPRWVPYTLRHTFGTHMASKVDLPTLAKLMGHQDIHQTMAYIDVSQEKMLRAVAAMADI